MAFKFAAKHIGWVGGGSAALVSVFARERLGFVLAIALGVVVGFLVLLGTSWLYQRSNPTDR